MRLYFVRHGETEWNALGRLQGESDIPLSEKGRRLAEITGEALSDVQFDRVIISPTIRTRQTAECIVGDMIPLETDSRIREITWGKWDGMTTQEIRDAGKKEIFDLFYTAPFDFPGAPGGETVRQVCDRGRSFLDELIRRFGDEDCRILIVTHGGAVRGILNHLYEDPKDFWQGGVPPNCSVNILKCENGKAEFLAKDQVYYDRDLIVNHYALERDEEG